MESLLAGYTSYDPGFPDLAFPRNPLQHFRCAHMRGRAGSVPEISVSVLGILPYEHFVPVAGMNGGMNSGGPDGIVLHCLLCFSRRKHPI